MCERNSSIDTQRTEDRRDNSICVLCIFVCVLCVYKSTLQTDPGYALLLYLIRIHYRCELYGGELLYKVNIYI